MGEVWRARDSKLGREVAIKTLPEEFARDEERLARFEREAKLLASLNHPNIATIHGLEETPGTDGYSGVAPKIRRDLRRKGSWDQVDPPVGSQVYPMRLGSKEYNNLPGWFCTRVKRRNSGAGFVVRVEVHAISNPHECRHSTKVDLVNHHEQNC